MIGRLCRPFSMPIMRTGLSHVMRWSSKAPWTWNWLGPCAFSLPFSSCQGRCPYRRPQHPVTVTFRSNPADNGFTLDRSFRFPAREPYHFRSTMVPIGGNEVIEWMPIMLGWRAAFSWREGRVRLDHRGYAVRFLGRTYRLPIEFLIGRGEASEEAIDETRFRMIMTIKHRLFGTSTATTAPFRSQGVDLER